MQTPYHFEKRLAILDHIIAERQISFGENQPRRVRAWYPLVLCLFDKRIPTAHLTQSNTRIKGIRSSSNPIIRLTLPLMNERVQSSPVQSSKSINGQKGGMAEGTLAKKRTNERMHESVSWLNEPIIV
mmetsp:Transcript_15898/g.34466  ORF Transcript_15898/g.34466 Transcript_15898/m.34466 type:complete len:128 (-) Transcript_15898:3863-4246(-)